jgi:hypothetical protein
MPKTTANLVGQRFGNLLVLERTRMTASGAASQRRLGDERGTAYLIMRKPKPTTSLFAASNEVENSIDRLNPQKGYSPKNCEWVTRSENSRRVFAPKVAAP